MRPGSRPAEILKGGGESDPRLEKYRSTFSSKKGQQAPAFFIPPESFGGGTGSASQGDEDLMLDLAEAGAWDVAVRYHEFKGKARHGALKRELRRISAEAVLERARAVLGAVVHPVEPRVAPLPAVPAFAEQVDFDLEETLDEGASSLLSRTRGGPRHPVAREDLWMAYAVPRRQAVVLDVDTSLSMTGEKLALTAVALAVVLLQFPEDPIGIVAFENEAKVLKRPEERISIHELVERFLDVPAQGYTHLEDGLRAALRLVAELEQTRAGGKRPPSTVLLSDGKYTAGRDPAYLAPRFPHLTVLKMGRERASLGLCRELAQLGRGSLREVGELEALPAVMYTVVKELLRGKSHG